MWVAQPSPKRLSKNQSTSHHVRKKFKYKRALSKTLGKGGFSKRLGVWHKVDINNKKWQKKIKYPVKRKHMSIYNVKFCDPLTNED